MNIFMNSVRCRWDKIKVNPDTITLVGVFEGKIKLIIDEYYYKYSDENITNETKHEDVLVSKDMNEIISYINKHGFASYNNNIQFTYSSSLDFATEYGFKNDYDGLILLYKCLRKSDYKDKVDNMLNDIIDWVNPENIPLTMRIIEDTKFPTDKEIDFFIENRYRLWREEFMERNIDKMK